MGSPGNPAASQMARSVIQALAQRGAGPSTQGGPQGAAPPSASGMLSSRLNELQGADPNAIMRKLTEMKQQLIEMIPHVAFTLPGVSKHISSMWKALDGAIKEAEQAVTTQQSASSVPIGMNAARPQPAQPDQAGGPVGGSPFMPGAPTGGM
jgi:hypothetical protein